MKSYRKNRIPQIIFGCDAAKETGKELQNQCVTRCLIVTDKGVRAAGLVDPILASLDACGISYIIFDDVKPETPDIVGVPTEEDVTVVANRVAKKYVEFYKQFGLTNLQDTLKAAGKLDDEDTFVEKIIPLTLDDFKSRIWNPSIHRPEDHDRLVALLKAIYNEA